MGFGRRLRAAVAATVLASVCAGQALASGGGIVTPWHLTTEGGGTRDLQRLYAGRLGVVMARSSEPLLFLDWRLLHGRKVGPTAGLALTNDCCTPAPTALGMDGGVYGWLEARKRVSGASPSPAFLNTERPAEHYQTTPNCFRDAFDTAIATLKDRVTRYGAASPAVRTWLAGQDAVFQACAEAGVELPPTLSDQPGWLRADRAYQAAALALYNGFNDAAATRFGDIARDPNSPWRTKGLYLKVRAIQREALAKPSPASFARSRAAIGELAAAPDGTYGKGEARGMLRALTYRDQPDRLLADLDRELNQAEPVDDIAVGLNDYLSLSEKAQPKPDAADWIATLRSRDVVENFDHARERWAKTRDVAWLIAALALASPDDPAAKALAADAAQVPAGPGWLTAQYHQIRLTITTAEPAMSRARLDRILARKDLSENDRNLFIAERSQVSTGLADFGRFATRRRICHDDMASCFKNDRMPGRGQEAGFSSGKDPVGFGEDARATIDRMPLAQRIALSRDARLPAYLRLDVALTSFVRAVQLQDNAAIDGLARDLTQLLPQMKTEWATIVATPPGPAKRFAIFFAMAKIPGLRFDLIDYTRPTGKIPDFQGYWLDWTILPRGRTSTTNAPPKLSLYQSDGMSYGDGNADRDSDLTCLGECGLGAFPLRLPTFVAAGQGTAAAQRGALADGVHGLLDPDGAVATPPKGSLNAWEDLLAYTRAHPGDPRAPEALYWLTHITHWGPNNNNMGYRAFVQLHTRYPASVWAKRARYHS